MALDICGGEGIYIPGSNCDDCSAYEARIAALEAKLEGLNLILLSITDANGHETPVHVLGR